MFYLEGIIELKDFGVFVFCLEKLVYVCDYLNEIFGYKFFCRFCFDDIFYEKEKLEDLVIINYILGIIGYFKGVMLFYCSIFFNVFYCKEKIGLKVGDSVVFMLFLGYVFGMIFDFFYGFIVGVYLWFFICMLLFKIIVELFVEICLCVIVCVLLIVEKIFKKNIFFKVDNKLGKLLLYVFIISDKIKEFIK